MVHSYYFSSEMALHFTILYFSLASINSNILGLYYCSLMNNFCHYALLLSLVLDIGRAIVLLSLIFSVHFYCSLAPFVIFVEVYFCIRLILLCPF